MPGLTLAETVAIAQELGAPTPTKQEDPPMPRYEIIAHVAGDLECDTPEEAAAVFRRQLLSEAGGAVALHHLAVWRHEASPAASALPPAVRRKLVDFFAALERCAAEAEETFRGRVAAILAVPAATPGPRIGGPGVPPERVS